MWLKLVCKFVMWTVGKKTDGGEKKRWWKEERSCEKWREENWYDKRDRDGVGKTDSVKVETIKTRNSVGCKEIEAVEEKGEQQWRKRQWEKRTTWEGSQEKVHSSGGKGSRERQRRLFVFTPRRNKLATTPAPHRRLPFPSQTLAWSSLPKPPPPTPLPCLASTYPTLKYRYPGLSYTLKPHNYSSPRCKR